MSYVISVNGAAVVIYLTDSRGSIAKEVANPHTALQRCCIHLRTKFPLLVMCIHLVSLCKR